MKKKTVRIAGLLLAMLLLSTSLYGCGGKAPLTLEGQLDLGMRYLNELDYENAVTAFTAAIEIDPGNTQGYAGLYTAHAVLRYTDLAEETWAAMLAADVSAEEAYRWIGQMADMITQAGGDGAVVREAADPMMQEPDPTPPPTPEAAPEPAPEPPAEGAQSSLGALLEDQQGGLFTLFDQSFAFPITGAELDELGFTVDSFSSDFGDGSAGYETYWPDRSTIMATGSSDWYKVAGLFRPGTMNDQIMSLEWADVAQQPVDAIEIEYWWDNNGESASQLKLVCGIDLNSSKDDVIAAYGEPDGRTWGDWGPVLQYNSDEIWMDLYFYDGQSGRRGTGALYRVTVGQMPRW